LHHILKAESSAEFQNRQEKRAMNEVEVWRLYMQKSLPEEPGLDPPLL
jgi:hypothetical protein